MSRPAGAEGDSRPAPRRGRLAAGRAAASHAGAALAGASHAAASQAAAALAGASHAGGSRAAASQAGAALAGTSLAGNRPSPPPRDTVGALDRGLALLRCFDGDDEGRRLLGASELSRLTGIPRPTVVRLAATLVAHRWLRPELGGGERYGLGPGVVALARVFLAGLDVRAAARGPMQALAERTGGSVYLALRDGLEMVLVEACRARSTMLTARLDVGSRVPLPNSALGRAYLGAVDAASRARLMESLRRAGGSDWPAQQAGLARALDDGARDGVMLSAGELHPEINSVAVAMAGPDGEVLAFNCGGPAFVFGERRLRDEVAPALLAMVQGVARDIGGTPVPTLGETAQIGRAACD